MEQSIIGTVLLVTLSPGFETPNGCLVVFHLFSLCHHKKSAAFKNDLIQKDDLRIRV